MTLQIVLAIVLFRYLQNSLKTEESKLKWNKILTIGLAVSIGLLAAQASIPRISWLTNWISNAVILAVIYLIYKQKDFVATKPIMYAVLPYILLSVLGDIVKLISKEFYYDWSNFFKTAEVFAVIWMFAMWLINRKQKKQLEKEHKKLEEIERENRITESLKAELEVQVAERTAALTQQKETLEKALAELKSTQSQLIQSEKMASLGELTAGIAHEIQNPLNFINNFSEVNSELIIELQEEIAKGNLEEVIAIAGDIAANEQKINHHGKRADAIVKGMLQHSRTSSGVKEPTDINALADEYLRLAYHGLRAKDKSFNAKMITDYDPHVGSINIIPQDIGRVVLNLITNAFYAAPLPPEGGFINPKYKHEPTIWVTTKRRGNKVFISVRDNGPGIPPHILDKIFQPFFTTKPTGHGTGLGLSLSYDIIKAHNGELKVSNRQGEGAEFIIELPI